MSSVSNEFISYKSDSIWPCYLHEKQGQSTKCKEYKHKNCWGSTKIRHKIDLLKRPVTNSTNVDESPAMMMKPPGSAASLLTKHLLDTNECSLSAIMACMTAHDG